MRPSNTPSPKYFEERHHGTSPMAIGERPCTRTSSVQGRKDKMNGENQPQASPAEQPQPPKQPQTGGSSKIVWIIIGIVVILLIIGGIVWYLMSRSKTETETTPPSGTATEEPESTSEGEALPSKDVAGEDIEGIPRYPDSVRVEYSKDPDGSIIKVTYQTKDSIDKVKEYYLEEMASRAWQMTSSEENQLQFDKEPGRLYIWFYYHETDKITDYELKYFPG